MVGVHVRRAWRVPGGLAWHGLRAMAVAAMAAFVGACASHPNGGGPLAMASAATPSGATLAFESIDGPPPAVFSRMVTTLNEEADARRLTVVSRSGPATYRVRGYVSALVGRTKTAFTWVWDVYDADRQRVLRITGEETAGAPRRRDAVSAAWAAADDQVVRRMARTGMERIAAFLGEPPRPASTAVASVSGLWMFAGARDDSPEQAGIIRTAADAGTKVAPAAR